MMTKQVVDEYLLKPLRTDHNWIQTFTGKQFWPMNPRAEDVCIEDIAHALSMKCRYTGHTREFYSVAQHCVHVSDLCEDHRWGLLHDAAEAYLPDVARPLKHELPGFIEIEENLLEVIANVFGLLMPIPPSVHAVDLVLLATEGREMLGPAPVPWISTLGVVPLKEKIVPWKSSYAKNRFRERFEMLFGGAKS